MTDRYELVGTLTRKQAEQVAELLAGGSVVWCQGHAYPDSGLTIRPAPETCLGCAKDWPFDSDLGVHQDPGSSNTIKCSAANRRTAL
jgi:hypothetical protein